MFLILTHSQDYYTVDLVANCLSKKGFDSIRINTNDFPLKFQISTKFPENKSMIYYDNKVVLLTLL